jgi:hypothetical protein
VNHPHCGVCCQICCNRDTGSAPSNVAWRSPLCAGLLLCAAINIGLHAFSYCRVDRLRMVHHGEKCSAWNISRWSTGFQRSSSNVHLHSAGLHRLAMRSLPPPSRGGCCTRGASSRCAATRPQAVDQAARPAMIDNAIKQAMLHAHCPAVDPSPHACSSAICGTVTRGAPSSQRRTASRTTRSSRSTCRSWWTAPGSRTGACCALCTLLHFACG